MMQSTAKHRCNRADIDWREEQYSSAVGRVQQCAFSYLVGRCERCQKVHLCVPVDLDLPSVKKHTADLRWMVAEQWIGKGTPAWQVRVWPGHWGSHGNH
jgi:hypothetical protein